MARSADKQRLGRGLDALMFDNEYEISSPGGSGVTMVRLTNIEPNPAQARKKFDPVLLEELAQSVKEHGIIQPIVVRDMGNGYYGIIAGERRWRAARIAGLTEVPVLIKDTDEASAAEISLIENLQRENLNPVEEAFGYKDLIENYSLTQEQAAQKVGKSRAAVANILRLLKLPETVLNLVREDKLTYGHARALLPLTDKLTEQAIYAHANNIISGMLSVRETEALVKRIMENKPLPVKTPVETEYYKRLENKVSEQVGRRVSINGNKLSIAYSGTEDLEQLIKTLCGSTFFEE